MTTPHRFESRYHCSQLTNRAACDYGQIDEVPAKKSRPMGPYVECSREILSSIVHEPNGTHSSLPTYGTQPAATGKRMTEYGICQSAQSHQRSSHKTSRPSSVLCQQWAKYGGAKQFVLRGVDTPLCTGHPDDDTGAERRKNVKEENEGLMDLFPMTPGGE